MNVGLVGSDPLTPHPDTLTQTIQIVIADLKESHQRKISAKDKTVSFLQARVQELERENLLLKEPIPHSETAPSQTAHHPTTEQNGPRTEPERPLRRPWWAFWRWIVPSEG